MKRKDNKAIPKLILSLLEVEVVNRNARKPYATEIRIIKIEAWENLFGCKNPNPQAQKLALIKRSIKKKNNPNRYSEDGPTKIPTMTKTHAKTVIIAINK